MLPARFWLKCFRSRRFCALLNGLWTLTGFSFQSGPLDARVVLHGMATRDNQNKISDVALREHCLAFVRLKHDQQQEHLEGMLAGLCGKQLREVVQQELQRVADDTALCFRNTSELHAQRSAHAPVVQSQPTKRAQREALCRIALDRAQATYDSQIAPKLHTDVLQEMD